MEINHLALWCADIEAMRSFYMKYFSCSSSDIYVNPAKHFSSYFLSFPGSNCRIELMHQAPLTSTISTQVCPSMGLAHFCIQVGDKMAVNAFVERMQADGYTIASLPRTTGDGYYEAVVLDPEGNTVEFCAN